MLLLHTQEKPTRFRLSNMKIGVLAVGQVAPEMLAALAEGLEKTFPDTNVQVIKQSLPLPEQALDKKRNQYNSNVILNEILGSWSKMPCYRIILGVVDMDIFASGLNYVFGEAFTPGRAALISLWRLKPEFYSDSANLAVYSVRSLKEAIHEVGHTLGLQHCSKTLCVMHFSNSIFDTDKKQSLFCDQCYLQAALAITNTGNTP
jgi:archaemetzincin